MLRTTIIALVAGLLCVSPVLQAIEMERQDLFRIERSKNANIIQYDAQVRPDGKLDRKKPVVAYWVRLAEQGQIKKLSWIQKTFAYGFKADLDDDSESVTLKMAADFGRVIKVKRFGQQYGATIDIDGKPSRLEKVYIDASGKGLFVTVNFIELHGFDLVNGEATYQRFVP
ncbi:MAG: DUF4833 domain-containing protein [Xanthomonadales bacterium]|nr:DUF4833 domain-containing protein [Gammaproteobacteria bacterium]MBT8076028.1 DUF4833 domain-containing protein [Gammaproteobacteria bacterium]NNK03807.1 DUF4833 domain-containing protein [Xanthomonadales bacterium]